MDTIENQIDEFRFEAVDGAKVRIVEEMAVNDDERVIPFLLEVLADPDEFELARVKSAKLLSSGFEFQRERTCEVLAEVIRASQGSEAIFMAAMDAASAYHHHSAELRRAVQEYEGRRDTLLQGRGADEDRARRDAELALEFLDEMGGLDL
ncbi:hypothetical protein N9185_00580 [bacterium]|jgi:hypothetical protein|nr:hypothetical protein [bacterium]MDB4561850.1 hypothetical protein [bacterium]